MYMVGVYECSMREVYEVHSICITYVQYNIVQGMRGGARV